MLWSSKNSPHQRIELFLATLRCSKHPVDSMDHDGSTAITIHADLIGDAVHLSDTQLGMGWHGYKTQHAQNIQNGWFTMWNPKIGFWKVESTRHFCFPGPHCLTRTVSSWALRHNLEFCTCRRGPATTSAAIKGGKCSENLLPQGRWSQSNTHFLHGEAGSNERLHSTIQVTRYNTCVASCRIWWMPTFA